MADILCYKCGSVIPPGSERCLNCGAPAPLPEDEIDKRKLRASATFSPDGSVHFNRPAPGYQPQPDEATRIVVPPSGSRRQEPEGATQVVHPGAAPEGATRVVHPGAAPEGATQVVHPGAAPEGATTIVRPGAAPEGATQVVHPEAAHEGATTIVHPRPHAPAGNAPATTETTPVEPAPRMPAPPRPSRPTMPGEPHKPQPKPEPVKTGSSGGGVPWAILIILAVLIIGGVVTYFLVASNDADNNADRYYALVPLDIYQEPTESSAVVDNVDFGARFLLYENQGSWSKVKYLPGSGSAKKGYVESRLLINNADMLRLTNLLSTNGAMQAIPEAVHRRALIDFMTTKGYSVPGDGSDSIATPNPWRLRVNRGSTPSGYNEVYSGRTFKRDSRYPDLGLILRPVDIDNDNLLIYYTFDENGVPRKRIERSVGSDNCITGATRGSGLTVEVNTEYVGY